MRIYNLDAECTGNLCSTVVVEPGTYDLFSDGMTVFWMMRGRLNIGGAYRLGDGLFTLSASDEPSDIEVTFPSRRFDPDEWADLLGSPEFTEGHDSQRLRLLLDSPEWSS